MLKIKQENQWPIAEHLKIRDEGNWTAVDAMRIRHEYQWVSAFEAPPIEGDTYADFIANRFVIDGDEMPDFAVWLDEIGGEFTRASTKNVRGPNGFLHGVPEHTPALDHDHTGARLGLLIEPASSIFHASASPGSNDFVTGVDGSGADPFGGTAGRRAVESGGQGRKRLQGPNIGQATVGPASTVTVTESIFVRPIDRNFFALRNVANVVSWFWDIDGNRSRQGDHTVAPVIGHPPERYGNGFYRIAMTWTPNAGVLVSVASTNTWEPVWQDGTPQTAGVADTQIADYYGRQSERSATPTSFFVTGQRAADMLDLPEGFREVWDEDELHIVRIVTNHE